MFSHFEPNFNEKFCSEIVFSNIGHEMEISILAAILKR